MTIAKNKMKNLNANALIGYENDLTIAIEDHTDLDGRLWRLEYASTHDGEHAVSFCRYSPWGLRQEKNWDCHVWPTGLICSGPKIHALGTTNPKTYHDIKNSPYAVDWVIERSRHWTSVYSHYRETGHVLE